MALALITFVLIFLGGGLASDVLGRIGLGDSAATIWLDRCAGPRRWWWR